MNKLGFYFILLFVTVSGFFMASPAWAGCDASTRKCSDVKIDKLIASDDGKIYAALSGGNPSGICAPAVLGGYNALQFVSIDKAALNFYGISAILRIAHEQDRILHEIQLDDGSQGCEILMVYSKLDE